MNGYSHGLGHGHGNNHGLGNVLVAIARVSLTEKAYGWSMMLVLHLTTSSSQTTILVVPNTKFLNKRFCLGDHQPDQLGKAEKAHVVHDACPAHIDQSSPSSAPTFPELIMWLRKPGKKSRGTSGGLNGLQMSFFFSSSLIIQRSLNLSSIDALITETEKNSLWME